MTKNLSNFCFIKVKCPDCGNEAVINGRASTEVKCTKSGCEAVLAVPTGGKAAVSAEIVELL